VEVEVEYDTVAQLPIEFASAAKVSLTEKSWDWDAQRNPPSRYQRGDVLTVAGTTNRNERNKWNNTFVAVGYIYLYMCILLYIVFVPVYKFNVQLC
jgi:hypothetical protein